MTPMTPERPPLVPAPAAAWLRSWAAPAAVLGLAAALALRLAPDDVNFFSDTLREFIAARDCAAAARCTSLGPSSSYFLFHGFIKSIPLELEEAAKIDGCRPAQTFYQIIFPILRPIHATVLVLNGIWIWNDYLLPLLILGKGNAVMTIPLAVSNFAGAYVKQWDLILTAILMAMIPIVIFFLVAQKSIIKGMVAGSIK